MFEMMLGNPQILKVVPKGQVQWIVPGTYQWTCPADVESVCCLLIAAGGNGGFLGVTPYGGYGGGCRWMNDIPVVPGQVYTIVVGNAGSQANAGARQSNTNGEAVKSSAFDLFVGFSNIGTPLGDGVGGGYGGVGGRYTAGSTVGTGGWAGLYTNGTTASRSGANDGQGTKGAQLTLDAFSTTGDYGAGGSAIYNGSAYYSYGGWGGAVRIIWGANRGYPANNIVNK